MSVLLGAEDGGRGGKEKGVKRCALGARLAQRTGAERAALAPNLFIVNFGTREEECEERRGFAAH